jgi:hypothetical protein
LVCAVREEYVRNGGNATAAAEKFAFPPQLAIAYVHELEWKKYADWIQARFDKEQADRILKFRVRALWQLSCMLTRVEDDLQNGSRESAGGVPTIGTHAAAMERIVRSYLLLIGEPTEYIKHDGIDGTLAALDKLGTAELQAAHERYRNAACRSDADGGPVAGEELSSDAQG